MSRSVAGIVVVPANRPVVMGPEVSVNCTR